MNARLNQEIEPDVAEAMKQAGADVYRRLLNAGAPEWNVVWDVYCAMELMRRRAHWVGAERARESMTEPREMAALEAGGAAGGAGREAAKPTSEEPRAEQASEAPEWTSKMVWAADPAMLAADMGPRTVVCYDGEKVSYLRLSQAMPHYMISFIKYLEAAAALGGLPCRDTESDDYSAEMDELRRREAVRAVLEVVGVGIMRAP